jgi:hypothetical protein
MVSVGALWLPILLSGVVVFVASSLVWMVLPHHKSDWAPLPSEAPVLAAMRSAGVKRGMYRFPFFDPRDKSPETQKKIEQGPTGTMIVRADGPFGMGKELGIWFLYLLFVSTCVAYLSGHVLAAGVSHRAVFRTAGGTAILAYASAILPSAIWWGRPWSITLKDVFDGVVYGLLTAVIFAWLWPH